MAAETLALIRLPPPVTILALVSAVWVALKLAVPLTVVLPSSSTLVVASASFRATTAETATSMPLTLTPRIWAFAVLVADPCTVMSPATEISLAPVRTA